ncbi:MAG: hypothetical protein JXX14_07255 [Deltaproteobacteria bacterium]|nr:hypothetical protein [Deltaproteobacteria bacterium]
MMKKAACLLSTLLCLGCLKKNPMEYPDTETGTVPDTGTNSFNEIESDPDTGRIESSSGDTSSTERETDSAMYSDIGNNDTENSVVLDTVSASDDSSSIQLSDDTSTLFEEISEERVFDDTVTTTATDIDTETVDTVPISFADTETLSADSVSGDTCGIVATVNVCDEFNRIVSLNNCGETLATVEQCGDLEECLHGVCICPKGLTGENCSIPVLHVNASIASDVGHSGRSWEDAFKDLQQALALSDGVGPVEIWVAHGRYFPGIKREDTFVMKENTALYGGFAGEERIRDQRDWLQNETILDGDIDRNDNGSFTMHGGNAYHVVTIQPLSSSVKLDGFTVRGGNADTTGRVGPEGGGLIADQVSLHVENCIFKENNASNFGGGIAQNTGYLKVVNSIFRNNRAATGGGMYVYMNADPLGIVLENVDFVANSASYGSGGASLDSTTVQGKVHGCSFIDNYSAGTAGGVHGSNIIFGDCNFVNNHAQKGGAMVLSGDAPMLENCILWANEAEFEGGAMVVAQLGSDYRQSTLITNTTIAGNYTGEYNAAVAVVNESTLTIFNSIIWGNETGMGGENFQFSFEGDSNLATLKNSILEGGCDRNAAIGCTDVLNSDPFFADETAGNLHLRSGSPAIDAGLNSAVASDWVDADEDGDTDELMPWDIEGSMRVLDGNGDSTATVDMGAYEYIPGAK